MPAVYDYQATDDPKTSFILEEFIEGSPLESIWLNLSETEKQSYAQQLAKILLDLAEVRLTMIGGLRMNSDEPNSQNSNEFCYEVAGIPHSENEVRYAPTVEYCKMIDGRENFHSNSFYHTGPYKTTKDYFLGCYEKEIFYNTKTDKIETWYGTCAKSHGRELEKQRKALSYAEIIDEPFVFIHGDFHGRNIMVKDGRISGVIGWEFAGSYPLSQVFFEGLTFVGSYSDEDEYKFYHENKLWEGEVREYMIRLARKRNWEEHHIDMLRWGSTDPRMRKVRRTMEPVARGGAHLDITRLLC